MRKNRRGATKHADKENNRKQEFCLWLKEPDRSLKGTKGTCRKQSPAKNPRAVPGLDSRWHWPATSRAEGGGVWVQVTHGTLTVRKVPAIQKKNTTLWFHKVPLWLPFPGPTVTTILWPHPPCFTYPNTAPMSVSVPAVAQELMCQGSVAAHYHLFFTDWKGQERYLPETPWAALCYAHVFGL